MTIKSKIEKILGVQYYSPHSPEPEFKFPAQKDYIRCGDCFCTIQEIHTHNGIEEKVLNDLVQLFKDYKS